MRRAARGMLDTIALALLTAPSSLARVYLTQDQALALAFPAPASVQRRTLYLDAAQAARAGREAGGAVETRVVPYYVGTAEGRPVGYAYFDTHLVRTLPETIMVLLAADGRIRRIDILSFDEPEDYKPTERWLQQFPGRGPGDELSLNGGIHALTGATLSARAVTQAARRVVALHRLFVAPFPPPSGPAPGKGDGAPPGAPGAVRP